MLRNISSSFPKFERDRSSDPSSPKSPSKVRDMSPSKSERSLSSPSPPLEKVSPSKDPMMSPEFRKALQLLQLKDLGDFENRFLKLDAFMVPWANFRDTYFLLIPSGKPRATEPGQISRQDLLHFYTYYLEGEMRYDPRADPKSREYTPDVSKHGVIDKSTWGIAEHEKILYTWLLQAFKVGKKTNIHGFKHFECANIATIWDEIFIPIVDAVRNDYSPKGRYHYGRLAKFIEDNYPSRLAFPLSNVTAGSYRQTTPRKVSQATRQVSSRIDGEVDSVTGFLAPREKYDEEDKELRQTFSKYGQVIERPVGNNKKPSIMEWIQQQKNNAEQRRRALRDIEPGHESFTVDRTSKLSDISDSSYNVEDSPTRKGKDPKGKTPLYKLEQRRNSEYSNLSAVPRPLDAGLNRGVDPDGLYSSIRNSGPFAKTPVKDVQRSLSGMKLTTDRDGLSSVIRHANSFAKTPVKDMRRSLGGSDLMDPDDGLEDVFGFAKSLGGTDETTSLDRIEGTLDKRMSSASSFDMPLGKYQPVPSPVAGQSSTFGSSDFGRGTIGSSTVGGGNVGSSNFGGGSTFSSMDVDEGRRPSYEGTGYGPSSRGLLPTLKEAPSAEKLQRSADKSRASRIPSPIDIPPNETSRRYHPIAHSESTATGPPPAIPPRNPARPSLRSGQSSRMSTLRAPGPLGGLGPRIVSRENISAALQLSDDELDEEKEQGSSSPVSPGTLSAFAGAGGRGLNTGEGTLQTYNTHMFPRVQRKATPAQTGPAGRAYEMKPLEKKGGEGKN